ncbi:MAG: dephospho-CoA kinase [Pyrinomonadaceae bacterium]
MIRVGLTGSIAVGKSYVASVLAQLGCYVIDADTIARAVVEPERRGYARSSPPLAKSVAA